MFSRVCPFCHEVFLTPYEFKVYCSARCKMDFKNWRRKEERALARIPVSRDMDDPWPRLGPAITDNALLDGWTCADEEIGGPMACQQCKSRLCPHLKRGVSQAQKEG